MRLLKQNSENVRSKDNKAFVDFYLVYSYKGLPRFVRVRPVFGADYEKFYALAETIPSGEDVEKYL